MWYIETEGLEEIIKAYIYFLIGSLMAFMISPLYPSYM